MISTLIKRSVVIAGHKTSVSLEQPFWDVVLEVARAERTTASALLRRIDAGRTQPNLSSAVRLFALDHARAGVTLARSLAAGPPAEAATAVDAA